MKLERRQLMILLFALLCLGFFVTTVVNYQVSKASIREAILDTELPLTSDNIYSEIQKDLIRPILVSSTMASDTFLRDWVIGGEKDAQRITRYLGEIGTRYGAHTAFFVSERSHQYYQAGGVLKQVREQEPRDAWYFRVRAMREPYELNVDPDMAHQDKLTIFVNYRAFDYGGKFIGATGIGLSVDAVSRLIGEYQQRYQRTIYFVDAQGHIPLLASGADIEGGNIQRIAGLDRLAPQILAGKGGNYEYASRGSTRLLNVRYIPELHWYLFVEKAEEAALSNARHTLFMNLVVSVLVTAFVLLLVNLVIGRYQRRVEQMATTDKLTGLANRQALELFLQRDLAEEKREAHGLALIMFDLDFFKTVNDGHGHLAGDAVLMQAARLISAGLRDADLVCRWGGEEFLVVLKQVDQAKAFAVAEKLRANIAAARFRYGEVQFTLTASAGIALLRADDTQESLISRADRALYAAKQSGRNVVCAEAP